MTNFRYYKISKTKKIRYVFSGSEDGNLRVWKTLASEKIGNVSLNAKGISLFGREVLGTWALPPLLPPTDQTHMPSDLS